MWTQAWKKQDTPRTMLPNQPTPKRFSRTRQFPSQQGSDCNRSIDSSNTGTFFQRTPSRSLSRRNSPAPAPRLDTEPAPFSSAQLALKQAQVMLLEDDNLRLKQQLQAKDDQYAAEKAKRESQYRNQIQSLRAYITQLQQQLKGLHSEVRTLKSTEASAQRQVKSLLYEKKQLEKQLDEAYQKRVSDKGRQLMSYRQAALQRRVEELQRQLEASRSELEGKLEQELAKAREQVTEQKQRSQGLSIKSRVMSRQASEAQVKYHQKMEGIKIKCKQLQRSNAILQAQLKRKRQSKHHLMAQSHPTSPRHSECSEKSLTFSCSSDEWF